MFLLAFVVLALVIAAVLLRGPFAWSPARAARAAGDIQQPVPSVLALSNAGREAELLIYGLIGDIFWEGITAAAVVDRLTALDVDTIRVRINSRGGAVDEGLAIYNALKRHPARIVAVVDGSAESIASVVAMAGDEVVMPLTSYLMLHAPYTPAGGNAVEKRAQAEMLDTIADTMLEAYAAKAPAKRADIEAMLKDGQNHYLTAAQAVEMGLANSTSEATEVEVPATAAAAALCSYVSAIAAAPPAFASGLRCRIQAATTPHLFASLPEVTQRAIVAHIEDEDMKKTLLAAALAAGPQAVQPQPTPAVPAAVTPPSDPAHAAATALTALRERNAEIIALAQPHVDNPDVRAYVDTVIAAADPTVTAGDVGKQILALMAKGRAPIAGGAHVPAGGDEREKQRIAMAQAIDGRTGAARIEGANPFRGFTMFELARACADHAGVATRGMDRMDIVAAAFTHSSSDFPLLLGDTARKALLRGYNDAPESFTTFTRAVSVTDFKPTTLAGLGLFTGLDEVPENGEYKYGKFSESGAPLKLVTYGKMFSISRQAIINDDLNALADVPRKMGAAAKRSVGDAVFAVLTGNPMMADGVALFHASHNNLVGTGSVLSTASVDGLRVLMATQKDANGHVVRVPLKYLVVPMGLGGLARTVLESQFEVGGSKNLTTPNIVRNTFEVIEDPRLDAASATAWYGVADPNLIDGIAVGYLDGKQEPYLESKDGWNVDGTAWKVRIDAAVAAVDHVGLAKNPGA